MGAGVPAHSWDQEQWEDWLLTLLDDTIREIDLDEWTVALAGSMTQQFGLYGQSQVGEKCFLMRCLGQVSWISSSSLFSIVMLSFNILPQLGAQEHYH